MLVPINFRLTADEIAYVVAALRGVGPPVRPGSDRRGGHHQGGHRFCLDGTDDADPLRARPGRRGAAGLGARRGRHLLGQLHVGHHGAAQGGAADAAQLLAERRHLRLAHRRQRPGRAAAHAAHVPLQRLGHALRRDRHGWHARRAAQGRRRGDPVAHRAPRRDAAVRCAGSGRRHPGRGGGPGGRGPGRARARHGAHRGGRCAAAVQDDRAGGVRARVGVHPDLRPDRDGAAAHHQPGSGGVGRSGRRGALAPARVAPGPRRWACRSPSTRRARCWRGPITSSPGTGSSRSRRTRRSRAGGSTPATAATSTARTW